MKTQNIFNNLLARAQKEKYAIPAFNFDNLEILKAILAGAEAQNSPVILMATHSAIKYMNLEYVKAILKAAINNTKCPVVAFLDHCQNLKFIIEEIDDTFQAIMYDGSQLSLSENIEAVQTTVAIAQKYNIAVEAELGHVGGKEDDLKNDNSIKTHLNDLKVFLANTNVDALAISIGNSHGQYKNAVNLDFELLKKVINITNIPIVLHGASGIPDKQVQLAILNGVCKVNFGTELKITYAKTLRSVLKNKNIYDPRHIGNQVIAEIQKIVEEKIIMVGSNDKA